MDVVMRHCNKLGFPVECIECDGKFKSITDEAIYEMGIEMNKENSDDHIPEANRNIRLFTL